jgi:hypothetical protein
LNGKDRAIQGGEEMVKKNLAIGLSVVMAASMLAGCGGKEAAPESGSRRDTADGSSKDRGGDRSCKGKQWRECDDYLYFFHDSGVSGGRL